MSDIFETLTSAKADYQLINVYQLDSDDFYTGIVIALDQQSVVLATYNENGIKDGFVLILLSAIADVELSSTDLERMTFRIKMVRKKQLMVPSFLYRELSFDEYAPLVEQVLALTFQERQLILFGLHDKEDYYEGIITGLGEVLTFSYFNRFNYTKSKKMTINMDDVEVIEFGGLDLYLGKLLYLSEPTHRAMVRIEATDMLPLFLQKAQAEDMLISLQPKDVTDNFFVGRVLRLTDDSVVMQLLDMTGQFGGYVGLRLSEIANIAAESDYLNTVDFYQQENKKRGLLVQPVLRADWPLEAPDLWPALIRYAQDQHHVLRMRFKADSDNSYLGFVTDFDENQFNFTLLDDDEDTEAVLEVPLADCLEIAFDYLTGYLLEEEYR